MRKAAKSLGYALAGIAHVLATERNFLLFLLGCVPVAALGWVLVISTTEWTMLVTAGGVFLTVELINTSIERLVDTFDDYQKRLVGSHYHLGLKFTKDVSSAAALMSLITVVAVILIIFLPRLIPLFAS